MHDTEVLVVFCEPELKPVLLDNHPGVLFTVPHYDGHGAVLVRLADADIGDVADWLEDSYRPRRPSHAHPPPRRSPALEVSHLVLAFAQRARRLRLEELCIELPS